MEVKRVFSSDINQHARSTIEANFKPEFMYTDVTQRLNDEAPVVDLYVAGFPCQPFSVAGLRRGFGDLQGRGLVFFSIRDYINLKRPKAFILENVAGLVRINGGDYFNAIMTSLSEMGGYEVQHGLLDTKEHGIPHSRSRVYIVGIRSDVYDQSQLFPTPIARPSLEFFLEKRDARKARHQKMKQAPRRRMWS